MLKAIISINITLRGPILTQSTSPSEFGLDLVAARNAKGDFYLPGTLLTGKLRQAWQELQSAVNTSADVDPAIFNPEIDTWLGKPSEEFMPQTKQLFISDLTYQKSTEYSQTFAVGNRIKIDVARGASEEHQLVFFENPFSAGGTYLFSGEIHVFAANPGSVEKIHRHVEIGLRWTTQLGALRSVGFGRISKVACSYTSLALNPPKQPVIEPNTHIGINILPLAPFCVTGKPKADNIFESENIIPGGVIKGAIATTWNQLCGRQGGRVDKDLPDPDRPLLKKYFSKLRFKHAFPSNCGDKRPVKFPYSLVKIKVEPEQNKQKLKVGEVTDEPELLDIILLNEPCLIKNKAPEFFLDWKKTADVNERFGWPTTQIELRTRTSINPDTLRSADNELFSYEQVVPGDLIWNSELDLSLVDPADRLAVYTELRSLLSQGIAALGKTKTPAGISWLTAPMPAYCESSNAPIKDNAEKLWIIVLQTDTLLGAPKGMDESSGLAELQTMYAQAWTELSAGNLELVRYFARQRLSGGSYQQQMFQSGMKKYQPWLLTEAGSVFLLKAVSEEQSTAAQACIETWLTAGLELSKAVLEFYQIGSDAETQWQACPFIPQNGYGEIAVNLTLHTQLKPDKKDLTSINRIKE